jgi:hypothetical protein
MANLHQYVGSWVRDDGVTRLEIASMPGGYRRELYLLVQQRWALASTGMCLHQDLIMPGGAADHSLWDCGYRIPGPIRPDFDFTRQDAYQAASFSHPDLPEFETGTLFANHHDTADGVNATYEYWTPQRAGRFEYQQWAPDHSGVLALISYGSWTLFEQEEQE